MLSVASRLVFLQQQWRRYRQFRQFNEPRASDRASDAEIQNKQGNNSSKLILQFYNNAEKASEESCVIATTRDDYMSASHNVSSVH